MPVLDMPLQELYAYQGINPRPADIDTFWDAAIARMEALGTACEMIPSEFQVPGVQCFDLYFTGMGGARIHGRLARPAQIDKPLPAIIHFHGYHGRGEGFLRMLSWVQAGFVSVSMDCRGQGGLSEDVGGVRGNTLSGQIIRGLAENDPAKLLFTQIFLDAAQIARIVMAIPEVDETRVSAMGGSQGGGLTLACAALTPNLYRACPTYPFLCDYKRVWEMDLDLDAYAELRDYFRRFDPRHEREDEIFTLLGYIDNQHIAHRIRAEVKMFTGLLDNICPPSTQFAAYNKITAPKSVVIYPDFKHETLPDADEIAMTFLMRGAE